MDRELLMKQQGWKKGFTAGKFVLCEEDGSAAINEIVEIGSEKYYLDYNGQMELER